MYIYICIYEYIYIYTYTLNYKAFDLHVAQGPINGAPDETHS